MIFLLILVFIYTETLQALLSLVHVIVRQSLKFVIHFEMYLIISSYILRERD